jgi:oxygen-dependent protoporphyrinogen oxidase
VTSIVGFNCDVAILGAGISGLCSAHHCARAGLSCLVLEEAATPGGCIHTVRTPDGFWYELGAHTLYNSYGALLDIVTASNLGQSIERRLKAPFRLLVDGKVRSVPSQLAMGQLFASAWRIFTEPKANRSVGEYYGRLVGKRNWKRVFSPLLSAVPSQRADDFPAEMLFKRRPRHKEFPRTFTLKNGLATLVDKLAGDDRITLRLNAGVRALARTEQGYAITTADGKTTTVPNVILALPPDVSARLVAPLLPDVAAALAKIHTAAVISTGVVFKQNDLVFPRLAGLVPLDDVFFSAVSRDVVPDDRFRALAFHFRTGLTMDERLDRIADVTGASRKAFVHVAEHATTLPSPELGHVEIVGAIDRGIAGARLYVTGNFFGGLAIEDCVVRSAAETARLIVEGRAAALPSSAK